MEDCEGDNIKFYLGMNWNSVPDGNWTFFQFCPELSLFRQI